MGRSERRTVASRHVSGSSWDLLSLHPRDKLAVTIAPRLFNLSERGVDQTLDVASERGGEGLQAKQLGQVKQVRYAPTSGEKRCARRNRRADGVATRAIEGRRRTTIDRESLLPRCYC